MDMQTCRSEMVFQTDVPCGAIRSDFQPAVGRYQRIRHSITSLSAGKRSVGIQECSKSRR